MTKEARFRRIKQKILQAKQASVPRPKAPKPDTESDFWLLTMVALAKEPIRK